MLRKISYIVIFQFVILFSLFSQNLSEPLLFLGATLDDVFSSSSIPDEVFSYRGEVEKEDNVVFYYSKGFYLFFFDNRVWQIRYDKNFLENISEIKLGMDRQDILDLKGTPLIEDENSLVYKIEEKNYPVRMKLFFVEEKLDDLYFYRSDY